MRASGQRPVRSVGDAGPELALLDDGTTAFGLESPEHAASTSTQMRPRQTRMAHPRADVEGIWVRAALSASLTEWGRVNGDVGLVVVIRGARGRVGVCRLGCRAPG